MGGSVIKCVLESQVFCCFFLGEVDWKDAKLLYFFFGIRNALLFAKKNVNECSSLAVL